MPRKYTKEEILNKFKEIHGDKYDYSLWTSEYKNSREKIPIKCNNCGKIFKQSIKVHYDGHGCPYGCYVNNRRIKLSYEEFINQLIKNKMNKYFYFLFDKKWFNQNYKSKSDTKFPVKCKTCGKIYYKNGTRLYNGERCFNCYGKKKLTKEKFLELAHNAHGNKYIYLNLDQTFNEKYQGIFQKIKIICPIHGEFYQNIASHIFGLIQGCPKCNESKGERKIRLWLEKNNIDYIYQYKIKYQNRNFYFDFYIPDYNLAIEYDGSHHFNSVKKFGGEEQFKKTKERDELKNQYCQENNINLLRIPYWDFKKIDEILESNLK